MTAHAPKWLRDSAKLASLPTSSMSGYAHAPGRERGSAPCKNGTVEPKLERTRSQRLPISPDVLKRLYGQSEGDLSPLQWLLFDKSIIWKWSRLPAFLT